MTDTRVAVARGVAITSGGPTQTITYPGFGVPKGCRIVAFGRNVDGAEGSNCQVSIGLSDFTRHRSQSFSSKGSAAGTENVWGRWSRDDVISVLTNAGLLQGQATVAATTDGVVITWLSLPAAPIRLCVTLYGGADAQIYVNDTVTFASNSSLVVSSVPFAPDAIEFGGGHTVNFASAPTIQKIGRIGVGWATKPGVIKNSGALWGESDNQTNASCLSMVGVGCAYAGSEFGINSTVDVTAFSSVGFTILTAGTGSAPALMYMAMQFPGINLWTGVDITPTSPGTVLHSGGGFPQQFVSTADTLNDVQGLKTDDQSSQRGLGSIGPNTAPGVSSQAWREKDGQAPPHTVGVIADTTAVHIKTSDGTADALAALFGSFQATGYSRSYTTVPATGRYFAAFTIGQNIAPTIFERATEDSLEVLYADPAGPLSATQDAFEVLYAETPMALDTQDAFEILYSDIPVTTPYVNDTQDAWEILWEPAPPPPPTTAVVGPPDGQISSVHLAAGQVSFVRASDGQISSAHADEGQVSYG